MTDDQIYCKTPEGERALVQRTRLVQRNLRNVLILVDGSTTVEALTRKLGDGNFLRASLGELLRGGFIETIEENRVRRGLEAVNAPEGEPQTIPVPDPEPPQAVLLPPQLDSVLPEHSGWRVEPRLGQQDPDNVPADPETEAEQPPPRVQTPRKVPFWQRWFGRDVSESPEVAVATVQHTISANEPQTVAEPRPEPTPVRKPVKVRIKPIKRGVASEPQTNWASRLLVALLGLFALAAVAAILFPYDRYRSEVEQHASAWLGLPVSISGIRLALTAKPGITLEQVRVGKQPEVAVGSIRVVPGFGTFFGSGWKLGTIVLDKPVIDLPAIQALLVSRQTPPAGPLSIQRVAIERAGMSFGGLSFDDVSGEINLTAQADISDIRLRAADGALQLVATPEGSDRLKLILSSTGWRMPLGGGIQFDSVDGQGLIAGSALRIDKLEVRTLDGNVAASGNVAWSQRVDVSVQASYARINLQRLLAMLAPAARIQGEVGGKIVLRGTGDSLVAAIGAMSGGGAFSVDRGVFEKFDLVEAVRSRSDNPVRGGAARLENLEGNFSFDASGWRLSGIKGNSGAMSTSGNLNHAGGKLQGMMEVQLRGSANQVNVPVAISGTLGDPLLLARRRGSSTAATETGSAADPAASP